MRILLIDNFDSFVYNIAQALGDLGAEVIVRRNHEITVKEAGGMNLDGIVISPGPGKPSIPRDFGACPYILRTVSKEVPTLGICLGHQGIAEAFGGKVLPTSKLMHGKASLILHDGLAIYEGIENPFLAGRYHSLIVDPSLPSDLELSAWTEDGLVMGIRHKRYPIEGIQFHPESILTPRGSNIISNFLRGVGK